MRELTTRVIGLHNQVFETVEALLAGWFLGLTARLVFAAVLFVYYWNSAMTKIGDGAFGFLNIGDNAYFQIVPAVVEAHGYDASQVPFVWDVVVYMGTYSEIILPVLIVVGLATRLSALGMIGFVAVQSYVDIAFHGVDDKTVGAWFDRFADAAILDQRALWAFLLIVLVVQGPGRISLDHMLGRRLP